MTARPNQAPAVHGLKYADLVDAMGRLHPLDVLRDTIQPFPTFSEIYIEALNALSDGRNHDQGNRGVAQAARA